MSDNFRPSLDDLPILRSLYNAGYSILELDYFRGVHPDYFGNPLTHLTKVTNEYLRLHPDKKISDVTSSAICSFYSQIDLEDLKWIPQQIDPKIRGSSPIFFFGHSYGAYLINLLATQSQNPGEVKGYISYAGIWTPEEHQDLYTTSPLLKVTNRDPKVLAPVLVIHSRDDTYAPFKQMESFLFWSENAINRPEILIFDTGGHYSTDTKINSTIVSAVDAFVKEQSQNPDK